MLFRLALRNVFRSKARSAITIGALFFGVAMSLLLSGFVMGVGESLVTETIESRVGALQVHRAGYFEKRDRQPLALNVPHDEQLEKIVRLVPNVRAVTARISFTGLVTNGSRGTIAVVTAIDPSTVEAALPKVDLYLTGEAFKPDDVKGAHVGQELAHALGLAQGVPMMMQAQGLTGRDNALDLELRGLESGQNPLESKRTIEVPLAFAQSLLGMKGLATEYVVAVDDLEQLDTTAIALRTVLGPAFEVHTWEQLRPGLRDARLLQRAILGGISFVFLVIALFGVANTLLMSVLERTREIGTLLAVGMTRGKIAGLFMAEAMVQALIGAIGGLVVALVAVTLARHAGGFAVSMGEGQGFFRVVPTLLPMVPVLVVGSAVLGSVLAAVSPALRAARMRPVEALSSS